MKNPIRFPKILVVLCVVIVSGWLLNACGVLDVQTPTATSTVEIQPSSTPIPATRTKQPSQTNTVTNTPVPSPSATLTAIPTPTQLTISQRCAVIAPLQSGEFLSTGTLVYYSREMQFVMKMSAGKQKAEIYLPWQFSLSISPYTGTIAWLDADYLNLHFQKMDGKKIQIPISENLEPYIRQWLPGDRVILDSHIELGASFSKAEDNLYLIYIDSGNIEHFQFEFSGNFAVAYSNQSLGGKGTLRYNPNLSKVIYGWVDKDTYEEGLLLWDIQNKKVLWQEGKWEWFAADTYPDWQQDGSHVAITAPSEHTGVKPEIFSLSEEGQATRLTHLADIIPDDYTIYELSWSPDERYIAFVFNKDIVEPYTNRFLYNLDTQTGIITDYCLPAPVRNMVWSPDSKQIGVNVDNNQLYILDLSLGEAQYLDNISDIYGWVPGHLPKP